MTIPVAFKSDRIAWNAKELDFNNRIIVVVVNQIGRAFDTLFILFILLLLLKALIPRVTDFGRSFRAMSSRDFELLSPALVVRDEELFNLIQEDSIYFVERG